MIAVSDTTPLRYLVAVGKEHLLGDLFERVFVPVAVHEELTEARAPEKVRERILLLPAWFEVRQAPANPTVALPVALHRGEREAILLAELLSADILLIDEQVGRAIAIKRNLPVSGTLGVLERADTEGLIRDFPGVLSELRASGFFISDALEQQLLRRHRTRRASK